MLISFQFQPPHQMRIQKTLSRRTPFNYFFRTDDFSICDEFTAKLNGEGVHNRLIARFTLATKNPKKKGFKKVQFNFSNYRATIEGKEFQLLDRQRDVVKKNNIPQDQTVWMKVELA